MKKLKLLLPAMVLMLCLSGCGNSDSESNFIDVQDYSEEAEGQKVLLSNDKYEFSMDCDTTQFSVKDKVNNNIWYSNPQDVEQDTLANGVNKTVLSSTFIVKYSDSKGQDFSYDNYAYSIKDKKYSIEVQKDEAGNANGVKVLYTVGDIQKTYMLPYGISEARMEELCSKMDEADAKKIKTFYRKLDIDNLKATDNKDELLAQYPGLADSKMFVLRDGQSDSKLEEFEKIFKTAGYTAEDYQKDMENVNIKQESGKAAFNVAVYYTLDEDGLLVDIPMNEIEFYDDYPITNLTPLPYFGAAGLNDEGYLFVPDGSGGKINFNNQKLTQAAYYNQVYGYDLGITRDAVVDDSSVSYPLIGLAKKDASYLCAVEKGSAYAVVEADIAGRLNSYNSVKYTYTMLHGEKMDISGKSDVTVKTYEKSLPDEHIVQKYLFRGTDDYVELAGEYREYLKKTYPTLTDKADGSLPFVVEMVGGVDNKSHVLGVPVTKDLPLTTYDDASEILDDLKANGVDKFNVRYTGWSNGGIHNSSMRKVRLTKKLGSKKDLKQFVSKANDGGVNVFMDANLQFVYKNKMLDGYWVNRDSSKFVSRKICELSYYSPIYFAADSEEYTYNVTKPEYAMGNADVVNKYITSLGTNSMSFGDVSQELCGDYNYKNRCSREAAMNLITDKYKEFKENGTNIMANSDYFYNIPYADVITGTVLSNKSFNIVDETIPFYEIALHGLVDYTAESLNLSQDAEETFLKSAELGAGLYYTVTKQPTSVLQDSKYTEYFATDYSLWKDTIAENYKRFVNDFDGSYDDLITGHSQVAENVYRTEFSDGRIVLVNYNYNPVTVNGEQIPARDYVVKGGTN